MQVSLRVLTFNLCIAHPCREAMHWPGVLTTYLSEIATYVLLHSSDMV